MVKIAAAEWETFSPLIWVTLKKHHLLNATLPVCNFVVEMNSLQAYTEKTIKTFVRDLD